MKKKTEVAIGILTDNEGKLLVGRRMRAPQVGKWEMPGGKVEPGETVVEALCREFREEGSIELQDFAHWTNIDNDTTILYLYRVFSNDPFIPTIYEESRYVSAGELPDLDWIASNR
ncbi:MAG: NUDIX domain-containing protein, partial [Erysipelotrichales bacterium]